MTKTKSARQKIQTINCKNGKEEEQRKNKRQFLRITPGQKDKKVRLTRRRSKENNNSGNNHQQHPITLMTLAGLSLFFF